MPDHQLIQRGPKDFYCAVCHQQWQSKSKAYCPGLHVVKGDEWGTLMTKTMLGKAGYKNDQDSLPEPKACYRRSWDGSSPEYVMLYDRVECIRKKEVKKGRRKTGYLSQVVMTPVVVELVERYREAVEMKITMPYTEDNTLWRRIDECEADVCNALMFTQLMPDTELDKEGFITVEVTPLQFSKGQVFEAGRPATGYAARNILTSYLAYLKAQEAARTEQPTNHVHVVYDHAAYQARNILTLMDRETLLETDGSAKAMKAAVESKGFVWDDRNGYRLAAPPPVAPTDKPVQKALF